MSTWRRRTSAFSARAGMATLCFVVVLGVFSAKAQNITPLIQFTNVWKYDQSGRELSTAWRTNDYDDSAWPSGRGLLGFEDNLQPYAVYAPLLTQLTISPAVTTFYFRATFNFTGTTNGLSLIATNLVDDGCAIYLNGLPVGVVRAPPGYNATTTFAGPTMEGQLDVVTLTNLNALRPGRNVLAVEVHQSSTPSADIMWGMKLVAIEQTPLVITNQPLSQTVTVGDAVTLSVGASGGPAFYRWQKDGVTQPSTSNTLNIASVQPANAGHYRVIITNSISAVTSSVATLTVLADITGPRLVAAIGNNSFGVSGSFASNTINVIFSETLSSSSAQNSNNYTVIRLGTTNTIPVSRAIYGQALGTLLTVDSTDPDWLYGGDYVLTVNGVKDTKGNVIAPDSQVPVSWLRTTSLIEASDSWRFHNSAIFEPGVVETNWYACDFVESFWWADGPGCFYFGPFEEISSCGMTFPATPTGFQPEPILFRTWFNWPTNLPTADVVLRARFVIDDGAVFYLNGAEIARYNMPGGPVHETTKATTIIATPNCTTNNWPVTNVLAGSNCLAVGIFQAANAGDLDIVFCFELDASYRVTPALAPDPTPALTGTALGPNQLRLSWTGHGYALESATNLNLGPASYPLGPWQEVTNMSNPYTNSLDEPQRYYRLKK